MRLTWLLVVATTVGGAQAQQMAGRDAFMRQQAFEEMQRVSGQIDVLQENHNELAGRVAAVERSRNEVDALRAEIASLRAEVATLKNELGKVRGDIVKDLSGSIRKIQQQVQARPAPSPATPRLGSYREHVVEKGDTLSLIAQAFGTTVGRIREANGLKSDMLRLGQKIKIPME